MVGAPRGTSFGRLTKSAALLEFLRGQGIHLLLGEAAGAPRVGRVQAAIRIRAATRRRGAEAQVAAPTLTLVLPLAPTVVALLLVFGRAARATGRAGGEREDDGNDTHRRPVRYSVRDSRRRPTVEDVTSKSRAPRCIPAIRGGAYDGARAQAVQFITAAMMYEIYAVHS